MKSNLPLPMNGVNLEQLTQFVGLQMKRLNDVLGNIDGENIVDIKFNLNGGAYIRLNRKGLLFNDGVQDTFKVDIDGNLTLTGRIEGSVIIGSEIKTSDDVFPFIALSSSGNLLAAYLDALNYIAIDPDLTGTPTLRFKSPALEALISLIGSNFSIITVGGNISINAQSGNLNLGGNSLSMNGSFGYTGSFTAGTDTVTVINGIITDVS